jgi:hypothetical protein
VRAVAVVLSVIVISLLVWWATGAEISGATLTTPWLLIIMASGGALIVAASIAVSRRYESGAVRARIVAGAIGFVVIGVVLAFEVVNLMNSTGPPPFP